MFALYNYYLLLNMTFVVGQLALDLAKDTQTQQVLSVQPIRRLQKSAARFEGMILKRSRFLGWKPVWVR